MNGSELLTTLLGAVALLLWGVRMVRTGMTRAFGSELRRAVNRVGTSRLKAFFTGIGVTAVLQSATATALLLAAFAGQGMIALPVALALMLGADVGSTLVAQVFAFDIKWLWAVGVLGGVIAFNASESSQVRAAGRIGIGLGLMLLALTVIGGVSGALRESPLIQSILRGLAFEPIIAVIVAALLTWVAHSSLAIVLLIMSLAASGAVSPSLAMALVIGANIGGAVAPYFALSGAPPAARRVPLGNLFARGAIALVCIPLLSRITDGVLALGFAADRQVLVAHSLFNLAVAIVWLPLVAQLASLATKLGPADAPGGAADMPQSLDVGVLETPSEALACAMRETLNVGDIVLDMLRRSRTVIEGNDTQLVKAIERDDDRVDSLHNAIKHYLVRASKTEMTDEESRHYIEILAFNTNLEHIGDIIDRNLMDLAQKRIKKGLKFSAEGVAELNRFHELVVGNMRLALNVFATRDVALARRLLSEKAFVRAREFEAADKHYARLRDGRPETIETSSLHLDIIRDLKRINSHLTSVVYPILEHSGELAASRLQPSGGKKAEA
jgi:phosphate:Na+ symporter